MVPNSGGSATHIRGEGEQGFEWNKDNKRRKYVISTAK